MAVNKTASAVAWCQKHGKLLYPSRKRAKRVARLPTLEHKNRPYECDEHAGLWHIGSLHPLVVQGYMSRDQLKGKPA